jgi:hypothetical protein
MKTYEEDRGIGPPFLTAALVEDKWLASRSGRSNPRINLHRYLLDRRLGGPQNLSAHYGGEKNYDPVGNRTPVVQPAAHYYTV